MLRRLMAVFAVVVFASWSPEAGAAAELTATVSPRRVELGQQLAARGRGCAPGDLVELRLRGPGKELNDSVMADEAGAFSKTITLPQDLAAGRATLRMECQDESGNLATTRASLLIVRPAVVIHLVNVLFGLGAFLVVFGVGWDLRNRSLASGRSRFRR